MTLAFWQAGDLSAAGRAVRDWARVEGERPAPHRFAARIYEDMGAIDLAAEAADRAAARGPEDADAWERVGRLRLRLMDREAAIERARARPRASGPSVEGLLDLALAHHLAGDLGAEVTATEQATLLDPAVSRRRGRATRTRWRAPTASATRSRPPSARCDLDRRRRRGRRPARAPARRRCRACSPPREGLGLRSRRCSARRRPGVEVVAEPARPTSSSSSRAGRRCRRSDEIPGLRVVQVLSAGVDWIADRVPPGVTLCSARGARDRAMAEWVVAAILADAKGAREIAEQQARRHWELVKLGDASNLRVLVLGFGSIGRALATMLAAFDCEVVGVARRAPRRRSTAPTSSPALLPEADVVVNLLPLTEATRGAVGARELAAMRDGALYVNAGRGATTDTDALVEALGHGAHPRRARRRRPRAAARRASAVDGAGRDDQPSQRGRHPGRRSRRVGAGGRAAAPLRGRRAARERGQRRLLGTAPRW